MINYTPVLNQVLGMAQMLSMAAGPVISSGVIVLTTLAEILNNAFGPGGEDEVTSAMQALGSEIESHMDELFSDLVLELKQLKMDDAKDIVSGIATELANDQISVLAALGPNSTLDDLAKAVEILMTHAKAAVDGESPISQVIEFAKDNATAENGYSTLPLLFGAVLGLANFCKYVCQIQVQLDAKKYLVALHAPKPANPNDPQPQPLPPPDGKHGDALFLNSYIYSTLQQTITFALPLVQAMNTDVATRSKCVAVAAAKVQLKDGILDPTVAIATPTSDTPVYAGFVDSGYGVVTPENLNVIAMLLNAQSRRTAWLNATASSNIYLFGTVDILSQNYILSTLNNCANTYFSMLPVDPANPITPPEETLPCIYPKPNPYTVQTGDTLAGLAARFQTTVAVIAQLNDIADPSLILSGTTLIIPGCS